MAFLLSSTDTTLTGSYTQDSLVEIVNGHSYYADIFGANSGQDFTVTNQGNITAPGTGRYVDGILLGGLGTVINQGTIIVDGGDGIQLQAGGAATNTGFIDAAAFGIASTSGYVLNAGTIMSQTGVNEATGTVKNTGLIATSTLNGDGIVLANGGAVFNTGTITGEQGILIPLNTNAPIYINNRGTISVKGLAEQLGKSGLSVNDGTITAGGDGIDLTASGTVLNDGQISAKRFAISATQYLSLSNLGTITGPITAATAGIFNDGAITGLIHVSGNASLTNYGTIAGTNASISFASGAVFNTGIIDDPIDFTNGTGDVFNAGLIQALQQTAINIFAGGVVENIGIIRAGAGMQDAAALTLTNAGTIDAYTAYGVLLRGGGTVSNAGIIQAKSYGVGARERATITNGGNISASAGDGIILSAGGTVTNTGTISALTAISIIGTAAIINDSTILGAITATGAASLDNYGLITAFPGSTGPSYVNLGSGNLTNTGTIMEAIEVSAGPGTIANAGLLSAVTAASSLALTNTGTIAGSISTAGTISLNNFGVIDGAGLNLGGGIVLNTNTILGAVALSGSGDVTNFGLIQGGIGSGVELEAGGSAANFGTIQGLGYGIGLKTGGTATNQGYIQANYAGIGAGGVGTNVSYATIYNSGQISAEISGIRLDAGTVTNTGTIDHCDQGILLFNGGSVNNAGLIDANANINHGAAVFAENNCTVTNTGTLIGNSGLYLASGLITNSGIIQGTGTKSNGIFLFGGATSIQNTGTITADTGIRTSGAATITNAAGATIAGATIAIELAAGSTLTNAGTITGATAISFAASAADRLIISPTSTITGSINGGGGTLELAAATSPGTFTAKQEAQFANFTALQVDKGAVWDFSGTQSLASATLQNNGTIDQSAHTTLIIKDAITGNGTIKLAAGALALENTVASQQIIDFTGTGETLALADPHQFTGKIEHFAAGDTIDLTSISLSAITATHFVHSVLTITEAGTNVFFTFANPGTFTNETFKLTHAGHGTDITLAAAAAHIPVTYPTTTLAPLPTFA